MFGWAPDPPRYVAVEGVIGVGKTTLVQQLAKRLGARTVFEQFEENPFLPDFYRDREALAFSTQIFFLMSRFRQQEILAQGDLFRAFTLADYCFDKDRIFAVLNLEARELEVYERLFDVLRLQVPRPDLIVYLRADIDVIMRRIAERGRPYEQNIETAYIREIADGYARYFRDYRDTPVLTIDTTDLDLRSDDETLSKIEAAVRTGESSRWPPPREASGAPISLPLPGLG